MAQSTFRRISLATALALLCAGAASIAATPARSAPANDIAADFGWSPSVPAPGQTVTFTASAGPPAGVSVKGYDWDFNGDGNFDGSGQVAPWSFPSPGTYTVRLRVRGNGNHRGGAAHAVTVQAPPGPVRRPPVAAFTVAPSAPVANQPVLLTSTSTDPDGAIADQVWDLNGDGTYDNGAGTTALRTFSSPGDYVVGLRVTDDAGLVSFAAQTITVAPAPGVPVATQKAGLRLLAPFPIVRIAGRITRRGTKVRLLRVNAPVGSKVSVTCTGRGCPFRKQVRAVSADAKRRSAVTVRVRRLERLVLPGVRVRVFVTKRGAVGKYTRFRFRRGKAPVRTDSCVMPGSWTPAQCPAA